MSAAVFEPPKGHRNDPLSDTEPEKLWNSPARVPPASVAQLEEHRASNPGAEVRVLSEALATPWPSGEARACNARDGGSNPPGVFVAQ